MTVKISGTDGIDTAQLRAPDGDPVAMTIAAGGKVAFPAQGQSLVPNGYVKLPGGLTIQWGLGASDAAGTAVVTFPTPFDTACLQLVATAIVSNQIMAVSSFTQSNFTAYNNARADGAGITGSFRWIAIGY